MAYRPEVDEIVLIERAQDFDCFKAKIVSISEDGKTIGFVPHDVFGAEEERCSIDWITWSFDDTKNDELQRERAAQEAALDGPEERQRIMDAINALEFDPADLHDVDSNNQLPPDEK